MVLNGEGIATRLMPHGGRNDRGRKRPERVYQNRELLRRAEENVLTVVNSRLLRSEIRVNYQHRLVAHTSSPLDGAPLALLLV